MKRKESSDFLKGRTNNCQFLAIFARNKRETWKHYPNAYVAKLFAIHFDPRDLLPNAFNYRTGRVIVNETERVFLSFLLLQYLY